MTAAMDPDLTLGAVLDAYTPLTGDEERDVAAIQAVAAGGDPWSRAIPLHATSSAVILHPPTQRVLLRWHDRMQSWLQVGGHADPGETLPFQVALREAREETGLGDLVAWPDPRLALLLEVVVVHVPAGKGEPEHHHADLRYLLATDEPDRAVPESPSAPLRWLTIDEALAVVAEDNLRGCLQRVANLLAA